MFEKLAPEERASLFKQYLDDHIDDEEENRYSRAAKNLVRNAFNKVINHLLKK